MYSRNIHDDLMEKLTNVFNKLFLLNELCLDECRDLIDDIRLTIDSNNGKDYEYIFNLGYCFGIEDGVKNNEIPFYVYMDIIAEYLNVACRNNENDEYISRLVKDFRELKLFTQKYSRDNRFDPLKNIDKEFLANLYESRGNLSFYTNTDYDNLLMVRFRPYMQEMYKGKDGKCDVSSIFNGVDEGFLYLEDRNKYEILLDKKNRELKELYDSLFERYFVDGKMPVYENFDNSLKDSLEIHAGIRDTLKELVFSRKRFTMDKDGEIDWYKDNLLKVKYILRREAELEIKKIEEDERFRVLEVKENVEVVNKSKKEIVLEIFKLFKELLVGSQNSNNVKKKK